MNRGQETVLSFPLSQEEVVWTRGKVALQFPFYHPEIAGLHMPVHFSQRIFAAQTLHAASLRTASRAPAVTTVGTAILWPVTARAVASALVQHPSHGGDGGAPDGPRAPAPAGAPVGAVGAPSGCATSCSVTGRYSARVLRIFLRVIEQSLQSLSPSAAQVAQGKWGSSAYRRSGFHPPV